MTLVSRNIGGRVDVHYEATTWQIGFCRNEHAYNSRRIAVSMQRQGKHTSITVEELLGNGVFIWIRLEAI
jgi:hypothetical protein